MIIWVLAILLIALFGAIGYGSGAVRTLFSLAGLFVGALVANPLSHLIKPLIKSPNPVWGWLLPPAIIFFIVAIVFVAIGFAVHHFVVLHFKYKVDEGGRLAFERVNKRLGIGVGAIAGVCYTVLIGLVIYILGYFTYQVANADSDSALIRYLNQARSDMKSSGLEKAAAMFDPMPEKYYTASDIIGLVYNNPTIHSRLANYPVFLSLAERPEFDDLAKDTQYQQMLQAKSGIATIINDPKSQGIINNQEILDQVQTVDLKDLRTYLETGKSAKFDDQKIIGRWAIDVPSVITQAKIQSPIFSTNSLALKQLKKFATTFLPGITVVAAAENKFYMKNSAKTPTPEELAAAAAAPGAAPVAAVSRPPVGQAPRPTQPNQINNQQVLSRYGLTRAPGNRGGAPAAAPRPVAPAPVAAGARPPAARQADVVPLPASFRLVGQGSWQGTGDDYELTIADESGKERKLKGKVDNDRLLISLNNAPITLVLVRAN